MAPLVRVVKITVRGRLREASWSSSERWTGPSPPRRGRMAERRPTSVPVLVEVEVLVDRTD